MTYAYNAQVYKSKDTTPLGLLLSRHPSGPTTVFLPGALIADSFFKTDLRWLKLNLQRKITALLAKANTQMKNRGARYKTH